MLNSAVSHWCTLLHCWYLIGKKKLNKITKSTIIHYQLHNNIQHIRLYSQADTRSDSVLQDLDCRKKKQYKLAINAAYTTATHRAASRAPPQSVTFTLDIKTKVVHLILSFDATTPNNYDNIFLVRLFSKARKIPTVLFAYITIRQHV